MEFLLKLNKLQIALIAIVFSFAIAFTKYKLEVNLTELVVDAQAGIVVIFAFITSTILWVLLALSNYKLIRALIDGDRSKVLALGIVVAVLACLAAYSVAGSVEKRRALLDSIDPQTEPQRLRDLVGYQSGFGYEVDNRIASNPSTPIDILESLYGIEGQIGTDMSLASNSHTPNYILIELSKRNDKLWREHILKSLERNPKVKGNALYFDTDMVLQETIPAD